MANEPEFSNMASEMGYNDQKTESNSHENEMGVEEMLQALIRPQTKHIRLLHNQEEQNQVNK